MKVKSSLFFIAFLITCFSFSQNINLVGLVNGEDNLENIHVINRTQKKYTTTNDKGEFIIDAVKNDTIVFTAIQYKSLTYIVATDNIKSKRINVSLELNVNELPEAVIGFTLSGDLSKDVLNSDAKRLINFYDVGIPGFTGKKMTKSERLLREAGEFKPKMLLGLLGGNLPLNPILNGISGRTKELKKELN